MKRVILSLSVFLAVSVNGAAYAQGDVDPKVDAAAPVVQETAIVPDGRDAAFLPPPVDIVPEAEVAVQAALPAAKEASPITTAIIPEQAVPVGAAAPASLKTVDLGAPVASTPLGEVDPETVGLLAEAEGGFGPSLWQGISYAQVTKLLPAVALPTASPVLNDLARRLMLSTAAVPDGAPKSEALQTEMKTPRNLTVRRIEKLLALGAVAEAWRLSALVGFERLDTISLRLLVEAALISDQRKEVCAKIPEMMEARGKDNGSSADWEKALIICKLQGDDQNAVQLGLDLLREQKAPEDNFMTLVSRNVLGRSLVLPRRLTPLRAIDVAVLGHLDLSLPPEVYARPDPSFVPALLSTKSVATKDIVSMAERAGARGLLSVSQLSSFYKDLIPHPQEAGEVTGPSFRALQIKAALAEPDVAKKTDAMKKVLSDLPVDLSFGSGVALMAGALADVPVTSDYNPIAVHGARLMALAGDLTKGQEWFNLANDVKGRMPDVEAQFWDNWPLFALAGFVPNNVFNAQLTAWMDHALAAKGQGTEEAARALRERVGSVLVLLDAIGHKAPDTLWDQIVEPLPLTREKTPSLLLQERLRLASEAGHKGETILLALLVNADGEKTSVAVAVDTVRALRRIGLAVEAKAFAREAVLSLMMP